jgi:dihydropteroate synthase
MHWQTTRFAIDLSSPKVMGIVNVTPDSFSDGGLYLSLDAALAHCDQLVQDGAHILDIGGESTRPGALALPLDEELKRVLPIVRHAISLGVPVSVDTYKPAVMQAVLDLGVDIINDIWALGWSNGDGLTGEQVVASHRSCGVCMMQVAPMQGDVLTQVLSFLELRTQALQALGIEKARICVDPGIGFGKTVAQNFVLLAQQTALLPMGFAVLAGWSRKSSLAAVTQTSLTNMARLDVRERMAPSVTAAVLAVQNGAHVVRVHDVKETVQALKVLSAMQAQAVVSG